MFQKDIEDIDLTLSVPPYDTRLHRSSTSRSSTLFFFQRFILQSTMTSVRLCCCGSELVAKYKEKNLADRMSGKPYELFLGLFKGLAEKKVSAPSTFKSHFGMAAIKCSLKAHTHTHTHTFIPSLTHSLTHTHIHSVAYSHNCCGGDSGERGVSVSAGALVLLRTEATDAAAL
jgi:hypothetical protein